MSDQMPCCAHSRVDYSHEPAGQGTNLAGNPIDLVRDCWKCRDCGTEFVPVTCVKAEVSAALAASGQYLCVKHKFAIPENVPCPYCATEATRAEIARLGDEITTELVKAGVLDGAARPSAPELIMVVAQLATIRAEKYTFAAEQMELAANEEEQDFCTICGVPRIPHMYPNSSFDHQFACDVRKPQFRLRERAAELRAQGERK